MRQSVNGFPAWLQEVQNGFLFECFACGHAFTEFVRFVCVTEGLDPTSTVKLFELYQEWQRATAAKVGKNQAGFFPFA